MPIADLEKVKALANIPYTDTTYDISITDAILPTQDWLIGYLGNPFHAKPYYQSSTISFDDTEISDSAEGFDVTGFDNTMDFHVEGSLLNDGYYFGESREDDVITIDNEYCDELITEAAGELICITRVLFPRGLQKHFAKLIMYDLQKKFPGVKMFSLADYSVEYGGGDSKVPYPPELLQPFNQFKKMKFKG